MPAKKKRCKKEASLLCYHSYAATDSLSLSLATTALDRRRNALHTRKPCYQAVPTKASNWVKHWPEKGRHTGCGPVNRRLNRLSYRRVTGKTPDFALLEGVSGFKSSLRRKIFFFPSFSCMELFSTFFSF